MGIGVKGEMAKAGRSRGEHKALTSIEGWLLDAQLEASRHRLTFLTYLLAMALSEVAELRRPGRKSE
jgi:hypothetical protein